MARCSFDEILGRLEHAAVSWRDPALEELGTTSEPYRSLVAALLSSRTKDSVTVPAAARLFREAPDVRALASLPLERVESLIEGVGFAPTKAVRLKRLASTLLEEYGGRVPDTMEELVRLPGVGRKTASLVLIHGYGKSAICVDTHVHRICNRLGVVSTRTPEETERMLSRILPRRWWSRINELLVKFGQNVCKPVSPYCSKCPIPDCCERRGVGGSR